MKTIPLWLDVEASAYPGLEKDIECDVLIVGGGIAGMTAGYFLSQSTDGIGRIVLVDGARIGRGVTGHTTAKITSLHHLIYSDLAEKIDSDTAKIYGQANQEAIELIKKIVEKEKIDCQFERRQMSVYAESKEDDNLVKKEAEVARKLGLPANYLSKTELPFEVAGAVMFNNQAQFHPYKYILALAQANNRKMEIYENSRAVRLREGEAVEVEFENGSKISAKVVVVATHYPFYDKKGAYFAKLIPDRDYALAIKPEKKVENMHITASEDSYSIRRYQDLLVVGGVTHRTGTVRDTEECYGKLEKYMNEKLRVTKVYHRWSTQDNFTADRLPYIGKITENINNIYVATGFNGWGMSNGTMAGKLIADLISRRQNSYEEIFRPWRLNLKVEGGRLLGHNWETAKEFVGGKLGKTMKLGEIKKGEGGVVEYGGNKVLIYKDEKGKLFGLKPQCTHMGCTVAWNSAEKSWDCPCHGSRFDYKGRVIHGPAVKNLEKVDINR